jgi:pilus assembly protein Flp/PilA
MLTNLQFMTNWIRARFGEDDRGASLVEYALLVALIAVVCIVAVTALGKEAKSGFVSTAGAISTANHPAG